MSWKRIALYSGLLWILLLTPPAWSEDLSHEPLPAPSQGIAWKDRQQKESCEKLLQVILEHFHNARFYSIQGDSCRTALHAKKFVESVESCRKECPADFLEKKGFNEGIIRNVRTLHELGTKRCADGK